MENELWLFLPHAYVPYHLHLVYLNALIGLDLIFLVWEKAEEVTLRRFQDFWVELLRRLLMNVLLLLLELWLLLLLQKFFLLEKLLDVC